MKQNSKEGKKFKVILADCPWRYKSKNLKHGGALAHYPTMTIKDIKNLPVSEIAEDNSVLFLWATFPLLPEALEVIKSWGFKYKTCAFTWVKTRKDGMPLAGMGSYTKANAELCLLAMRGHIKSIDKTVPQILMHPRQGHSVKPDEIMRRIERLFGEQKMIELFARREVPGWDRWGDEA